MRSSRKRWAIIALTELAKTFFSVHFTPRRFRHAARVLAAPLLSAFVVGCTRAPAVPSTALVATPTSSGPFDALYGAPSGSFLHVSSYDTTGGNADNVQVAAGDSAILLDRDGPGVVRRLWITIASGDPYYLRRITLRMYWDGERTPSVEAPVGDFFGNGFDRRHYAALPMGMSSGGFYLYLPLPFRRHARIVIANGTGRVIDALYYNLEVVTEVSLPDSVSTFHAWWHHDRRTTARRPHLVLDARGSGQFVGVVLNAESYANDIGFLEGDEIWTVDGAFRGQGTGTEDYFNSGWYFDQGPYNAPYHGLVIKNDSLGRIAAYRWHIPDAVPFHKSIRVELEHGAGNESVADYATVAYWYQREPHAPLPPIESADARLPLGVKIPARAVPGDSIRHARSGSGELLSFAVPRPDRYELLYYPRARRSGGEVRVSLPGATPVSMPLAGEPEGAPLPPASLGVTSLRDSARVTATGVADPAAIEARPLQLWSREWSIVGPFPSSRTMGSEHSAALDSAYAPERDPSLEATYVVEGGRRAGWKRVSAGSDGQVRLNAQFTPNDWVAAYGQSYVFSPTTRRATLLLGADDAHELWVNGVPVSRRDGRHESTPDDVSVTTDLRAGWNRILVKVADLDGGWAFQLRVADPSGELRWSATPEKPQP